MSGIFGVGRCPVCGSKNLVYNKSTGEVICRECGYVVKTMNIDPGPEWRSYQDDEVDRGRVGPPLTPLITDRGLATVFGDVSEDKSYGGKIYGRRRGEVKRVREWANRVSGISSRERNLMKALGILEKYGDDLGVPKNVLERAAEIYRMALEKDLVRGRSIKIIVAASLHLALREFQTPRPFKSMAKHLNIERKMLGKYRKLLIKELHIKASVVNPSLYLRSIVSKAGLPDKVSVYAEKIMGLAKRKRITAGKDPVGLASATVYYAALLEEYKISQRDLSVAAEATEVTVRNGCRYLMDALGFKSLTELRKMLKEEYGETITIRE